MILPLLCLFTLAIMLGGSEITARVLMPEEEWNTCIKPDQRLWIRAAGNCVSRTKSAESEWVENRYNECGYRSETSCRAPLNGAARIAVVGSSTSWGYNISARQTWYARVADALSHRCGRRIDVQNLSGLYDINRSTARIPEALKLKPDVIVMMIGPYDLALLPTGNATAALHAPVHPPTGLSAIHFQIPASRAVVAAQHLIFRQAATYISLYLRYGDKADFLRPPFSSAWRERLAFVDRIVRTMAAQTHRAGVPLVLVFTPHQVQADIVASKRKIAGVDPFALGTALGAIAERYGVIYEDLTPRFSTVENAPDLFFNVDGHYNVKGSVLLAAGVLDAFTKPDGVDAFAHCSSDAVSQH